MAGLIDFSQLFSDDLPSSKQRCQKSTSSQLVVPDAPVFRGIPDIGSLLGGDSGGSSLLDLQPSQWLPFNSQKPNEKTDESCKKITERGACDNVYLGSQFPLVKKVGPSQVERLHSKPNVQIVPVSPTSTTRLSQRGGGKGLERCAGTTQMHNALIATPSRQLAQRQHQLRQQQQLRLQNLYDQRQQSNQVTPQNQVTLHNQLNQKFVNPKPPGQVSIKSLLPHLVETPDEYTDRKYQQNVSFHERNDQSDADSQDDLFDDNYHSTSGAAGLGSMGFKTPDCGTTYTPGPPVHAAGRRFGVKLRSVTEIPERYRSVFNFPHFNIVQSKVFDDVLYTDKSIVLCSPTGSGKTAVLEMAIVRLLTKAEATFTRNFKIVYMAPIKALCSEKFTDWKNKFEVLGLKVMELTGDTDMDNFYQLQDVNIILTTPEKWDSMTRKWRENKSVVESICLFIVDEVHVLNDPTRGSVVEAVVSRMKTIQAARSRNNTSSDTTTPTLRFLAVSATITNIDDLAQWLSSSKTPALLYKMDETVRPVRLRKVVLGYHFVENKKSEFLFDISLSYKLASIIHTYSDEKPTLVFCSTRKSSMQSAEILAKDVKSSFVRSPDQRQELRNQSFHIRDSKLRDLLCKGIGYHHAGMDLQDRKNIEDIFGKGALPVLVATSTLAMGVNLPAHLVIVKSTVFYNMGCHEEYPDTQVLQMIGRAGRPQFDTSATAVIMTKNQTKAKYDNLLNGTQMIESSLHKNLVEHLNAEIVLSTITDVSVAVEWLKFTFLYIRVMKNPRHYGMPVGLTKASIEKRLQDMCMKSLNQLSRLQLIRMDEDNMDVKATDSGRLVARYCVSCKTAELFMGIKGTESVNDLLCLMSKCEEFADIKLRTNEKKTLNTLNKDKNRATIRYQLTGKIKTTDMKVNCLIQATLGSLLLQDFALQQDTSRIFRAGVRVSRCLVELLWQRSEFKSFNSALLLCKSFASKLWEDSKYVSKQLDGIGPTLSTALVNAGMTNFAKLEETNPREIELIVNRHPPFGNQVRDAVAKLPKYELTIEQMSRYSVDKAEIVITVLLSNRDVLAETGCTPHTCTLTVGDADNHLVFKQRVMDAVLMKEGSWSKKLEIKLADKGPALSIHYISQQWVGLDVDCTYTPNYLGGKRITSSAANKSLNDIVESLPSPINSYGNRECNHSCSNKQTCNHDCCKYGIATKRRNTKPRAQPTPRVRPTGPVDMHIQELKHRSAELPPTPSIANKRRKLQPYNGVGSLDLDFSKFAYTPNNRISPTGNNNNQMNESYLNDGNFDGSNGQAGPQNGDNYNGENGFGQSRLGDHHNGNNGFEQPYIDGQMDNNRQYGSSDQNDYNQHNQPFVDVNNAGNGRQHSGGSFRGGTSFSSNRPGNFEANTSKAKQHRPGGDTGGKYGRQLFNAKKQADWAELDMYTKHRHNCMTDPILVSDEEVSTPPGQDVVEGQSGQGEMLEEQPIHQWEDGDLGQETDYGYTYINSEDQASIPAEWDDAIAYADGAIGQHGQKQQRGRGRGRPAIRRNQGTKFNQRQLNQNKRAVNGARSSGLLNNQADVFQRSNRNGTFTKSNQNGTKSLGQNHQVADMPETCEPMELYDIEDFSTDDSFEAAANDIGGNAPLDTHKDPANMQSNSMISNNARVTNAKACNNNSYGNDMQMKNGNMSVDGNANYKRSDVITANTGNVCDSSYGFGAEMRMYNNSKGGVSNGRQSAGMICEGSSGNNGPYPQTTSFNSDQHHIGGALPYKSMDNSRSNSLQQQSVGGNDQSASEVNFPRSHTTNGILKRPCQLSNRCGNQNKTGQFVTNSCTKPYTANREWSEGIGINGNLGSGSMQGGNGQRNVASNNQDVNGNTCPVEPGNNNSHIMNRNILNMEDQATMNGSTTFSNADYNAMNTSFADNLDDLHRNSGVTNSSKWTNYFSSQSSTASQCGGKWEAPMRNDNRLFRMDGSKRETEANTGPGKDRHTDGSQSGVVGESPLLPPALKNAQPHKYGQVLAWVSNSTNQDNIGEATETPSDLPVESTNKKSDGSGPTTDKPIPDNKENIEPSVPTACVQAKLPSKKPAGFTSFFSAPNKTQQTTDNFRNIFAGIFK